MTTPTPTDSAKLGRQVRWSLVAIAIVALALISGRAPDSTGQSSPDTADCSITVTADVLNVRAGPGTEFATVGQLARDDVVAAEAVTVDGFRQLTGGDRWVADAFVRTSTGCE